MAAQFFVSVDSKGLDCSKSSPYKLCTASPIQLYHERVSRTEFVFPIFRGYKLIDKAVQSLYGLVLGEKRALGDTFQYTKLSLSETLSLDQRTLLGIVGAIGDAFQ